MVTVTVTAPAAPSSPAPTATPTGEPSAGSRIEWSDGTSSPADDDGGRKLYNWIGTMKSSFAALVRTATVRKEGDVTVLVLTVDEVRLVNDGNEEGPGYVNPHKTTRKVRLSDPAILVKPPEVLSATPRDLAKHLSDFDGTPFEFYSAGGELMAMVEVYHP